MKAAGIKNGDEVIIPNITFPATANAVKMAGGKIILADVNPMSLLMDEKSLMRKINPKTKFIIPVHLSGRGGNIRKILNLTKKKSIKIIEDAAEALGSKSLGKNLGTFGLAGCFSLAPNKILTTGQGGIVVTNNFKLFTKLKDSSKIKVGNGLLLKMRISMSQSDTILNLLIYNHHLHYHK